MRRHKIMYQDVLEVNIERISEFYGSELVFRDSISKLRYECRGGLLWQHGLRI